MKKVNFIFIIFLSMIFFPKVVDAYTPSYYINEARKYVLCPSSDTSSCFEISKNSNGFVIDSANNQVSYQGVTYIFSSDFQNIYNSTIYGNTTMMYYINKKGLYTLCENLNNCVLYTYNDLIALGAVINAGANVNIIDATGTLKTYTYNAIIQNEVDNGNDPGHITTGNSGSSNENVTAPITRPEDAPTTNYCTKLKEPLKFIGRIILIVKIVLPIIIIVLGCIDFFKAVTGAKDDEIKKSARTLLFRTLSGVVIFFIPTIISVIFSMVDSWAQIEGDFNACQKCIFRVSECE